MASIALFFYVSVRFAPGDNETGFCFF